ncbi:hypothetical protein [Chitinophaga varians]|uniref:hypothetical protein n=1 Tax=Chitinophaga varians TaxID=2202339 RepID=UPI00165F9B7A|nr:hypothetical protein [Chitinophaga varians]MBC9915189.1 hypothetical protein [Chitinophaga varians]
MTPPKKLLKYFLIFIGIFLVLILFVAGCFWVTTEQKYRQAKEDGEKYSRICDTIRVITEQPKIQFSGFRLKEIRQLRFKILRNGQFTRDTLVKTQFSYVSDDSTFFATSLPYPLFLKTDTIVVSTEGGLHYYISGYHHYASLHYGMFGYVGSHDCRFAAECMINNEQTSGTLLKNDGWWHPETDKHKRMIAPQTPAFDSISQSATISYEKAEEIFEQNKANKHLISRITYRIEVGQEGSFYVFGEEDENKRNQVDLIKINTQTGEYKRERR